MSARYYAVMRRGALWLALSSLRDLDLASVAEAMGVDDASELTMIEIESGAYAAACDSMQGRARA